MARPTRAQQHTDKANRLAGSYTLLRKRYLTTPPAEADMLSLLAVAQFYELVHAAESSLYARDPQRLESKNHDDRNTQIMSTWGTRASRPYKLVADLAWRARYVADAVISAKQIMDAERYADTFRDVVADNR